MGLQLFLKKKNKGTAEGMKLDIKKLLSWGAIFVCVLQYFKEIKSTHFENDKRIHKKGWEGRRAFSWVCFFLYLKHIGEKYCSNKPFLNSDLWLGLEALDDSFKGQQRKRMFAHSTCLEITLWEKNHQYVPIIWCKVMWIAGNSGSSWDLYCLKKNRGLFSSTVCLTEELLEHDPSQHGEKHWALFPHTPPIIWFTPKPLAEGRSHSPKSACGEHWIYPQGDTNFEVKINTNTNELVTESHYG